MTELKLYICQENLVCDEHGANFDETKVLITGSYEEAKAHFVDYGYDIFSRNSRKGTNHEKWFDEHMILHEIPLAEIPGFDRIVQ